MQHNDGGLCCVDQDMPFYTGEGTPFFERSKLATDKSYVAYLDLNRNFRPQKSLQDNCVVADTENKVVGKCVKVGRNRRKKRYFCDHFRDISQNWQKQKQPDTEMFCGAGSRGVCTPEFYKKVVPNYGARQRIC